MSSRLTYANGAAVLVDFIRECEACSLELKGDEAAIDFIASWLANGQSMQELVNAYALNWGVLAAWIRRDAVRNQRYVEAMADRRAMRQERLLDGWWQTAEMPVEGAVGHSDVHRARESLAKSMGMYQAEVGAGGGAITIRFDPVDAKL